MSTQASVAVVAKTPEAPFGAADLLRVIANRKGLIGLIAILTVLATAAVMFNLPTLYASTAKVMLDPRKNTVADAATVLSAFSTDPSSVQNQLQVLSSRDLAQKVVTKLHLEDDPEFNPALTGKAAGNWRDSVVNGFLSHLDVALNGASTTIDVTFKSKDPEKAARIANALAKSYTDDQVAVKVTAARKAAQWLSERMHALSAQVQQQEAAIQLYKAENDLLESAPGSSLVDQQLMAINTQLVAAQSDLAEKKAAYERVAALAQTGNSADTTQVVTSKMIGDLRAQEGELIRQEADLASRYGPNHPRMVAIKNARRDLAAKIAREVDGIAGSMKSDLEVAKVHVGAIEASLARTSREARHQNIARIKLNALEANLSSTRTMYENFVQRLRAVQDQDDIQIPEARLISTAPVPSFPASPKRGLFIAASLPVGILLGLLVALLLERFGPPSMGMAPIPQPVVVPAAMPVFSTVPPPAPRPEPPRYVPPQYEPPPPAPPTPAPKAPAGEALTGMAAFIRASSMPKPPLAPSQQQQPNQPDPRSGPALPPVLSEIAGSADLRLADWVLDNPGSPYGKALEGLLATLVPGPTPHARLIAVTAPAADAAKQVAVLALARLAAQRGLRTVLIDADLGRLAPSGSQAGIAGFLQGLPLASVMLKDRRTPLFLMAGPAAVWPEPRTAALLSHLKQNCDLILVDAAAPGLAGLWPVLASLSDSVVIYAAAKASPAELDGALRSLVAMRAPLKGLVFAR